jgi:hypothetical protein
VLHNCSIGCPAHPHRDRKALIDPEELGSGASQGTTQPQDSEQGIAELGQGRKIPSRPEALPVPRTHDNTGRARKSSGDVNAAPRVGSSTRYRRRNLIGEQFSRVAQGFRK